MIDTGCGYNRVDYNGHQQKDDPMPDIIRPSGEGPFLSDRWEVAVLFFVPLRGPQSHPFGAGSRKPDLAVGETAALAPKERENAEGARIPHS